MNITILKKMAVPIKKSILSAQVEEGMKKAELAAHYELPVAQMTKVLKAAGLKIRKFHAPKFELEDDMEVSEEVHTDVNTDEELESLQHAHESIQQEEELIEEVQKETPIEPETAGW